jgi:hypothetical protein
LLPIGFDLHGLRDCGDLYEVQSGSFFCLYPMAGVSIWTDITVHRNRVLRFGSGASSLVVGDTRPIIDLYWTEKWAICSREPGARSECIPRSANDFRLWVEMERKEPM